MKRSHAVIGGLVFVIAIAVVYGALESDGPAPAPAETVEEMPTEAFGRIADFVYTKTTEGRTEWELKADQAELYNDRSLAVFTNCNLVFYAEDGRRLGLTGRNGVFHTDTQNVEIEGSIIARSDDGYRLLTNSLRYDAAEKKAVTDDPVLFFGDKVNIEGTGLRIDVETQQLTLLGPVRGMAWGLTGIGSAPDDSEASTDPSAQEESR